MEYRKIEGVSKPVSQLLFGTASAGFSRGLDQSELLDAALAAGINTLDTARNYGMSEKSIGLWLLPGMKLVYDSGNMILAGEDPVEYAKAMKDQIDYVHLKDMKVIPANRRGADIALDGRQRFVPAGRHLRPQQGHGAAWLILIKKQRGWILPGRKVHPLFVFQGLMPRGQSRGKRNQTRARGCAVRAINGGTV